MQIMHSKIFIWISWVSLSRWFRSDPFSCSIICFGFSVTSDVMIGGVPEELLEPDDV
jgi:hypothetical protein